VEVPPRLLDHAAQGAWWETLEEAAITLLVTREYEHLVIALTVESGRPRVTFMPLPHPSGLAVDRSRGLVHIASTRNPNQIYDLAPVTGVHVRKDKPVSTPRGRPLVPLRTRFLPGSFYAHDLALIGGALHANAVGCNAIAKLCEDGNYDLVWWPRAVETTRGVIFSQNHLQLNSIAAGGDLRSSFFSASTDQISVRRPGHRNFAVDRRGVIFSGATREPVVRGLTRPHSARLHRGRLWIDNSGYGELALAHPESGTFDCVTGLSGWTRGLCIHGRVAFVGTSRVIPRFQQYAPGLDVDTSVCGIHAVDIGSGNILGSLTWPYGNQIFAVEWVPRQFTSGFPFVHRAIGGAPDARKLFYAFRTTPRVVSSSNAASTRARSRP
jgi:uncharacterized protein (TIGR03032 family)